MRLLGRDERDAVRDDDRFEVRVGVDVRERERAVVAPLGIARVELQLARELPARRVDEQLRPADDDDLGVARVVDVRDGDLRIVERVAVDVLDDRPGVDLALRGQEEAGRVLGRVRVVGKDDRLEPGMRRAHVGDADVLGGEVDRLGEDVAPADRSGRDVERFERARAAVDEDDLGAAVAVEVSDRGDLGRAHEPVE